MLNTTFWKYLYDFVFKLLEKIILQFTFFCVLKGQIRVNLLKFRYLKFGMSKILFFHIHDVQYK